MDPVVCCALHSKGRPVVHTAGAGPGQRAVCEGGTRVSVGGHASSHRDSLSLMVTAFTSEYSARAYSPLKVRDRAGGGQRPHRQQNMKN